MRRTIATLAIALAVVLTPATIAGAAPKPAPAPTIVDVAIAANAGGDFDTLLAAVQAADLIDALQARGQRTVFAPTDAAFAAIGLNEDNIGALPTDTLTDILLYHVTPGRKYAADVLAASSLRMLNGDRAAVDAAAVTIDGAPIQAVDIEAGNGVIHVVGAVLLP